MSSALLDTSIVLRLFSSDDIRHSEVQASLDRLVEQVVSLVIAPQVRYETRVVLTRPRSDNGLARDARDFRTITERLSEFTTLLPDPTDLVDRWLALCEAHDVVGKRSHDVRLVAWMQAHGVDSLLTLNPRDFAAFPIRVLSPGNF